MILAGRFVVLEPLLSSNTFTQGNLVKIDWLVTDETAAGSPGKSGMWYFEGTFGGVFF